MRTLCWVAMLATSGGCAAGARAVLFASTPGFVVTAEEVDGGVLLRTEGLVPEDFEDDLCDSDDGESCHDDWFLGIGFYRSDDGAYGKYEEIGIVPEGEFLDTRRVRTEDEVVWRAGTLRQEEEEDPYMDKVSIAASLQ